jgi:hypothetical protein
LAANELDDVCQRISQYLKEDKDRSQYGGPRLTTTQYTSECLSLHPNTSLFIISYCLLSHHLSCSIYWGDWGEMRPDLIELLVFHGLIPLGSYNDAITFLKRNDRVPPAAKIVYIDYVKQLAGDRLTITSGRATPLLTDAYTIPHAHSTISGGNDDNNGDTNGNGGHQLNDEQLTVDNNTNNNGFGVSSSSDHQIGQLRRRPMRQYEVTPLYIRTLISSRWMIIRCIGRASSQLYRLLNLIARLIGIRPSFVNDPQHQQSLTIRRVVTPLIRSLMSIGMIWCIVRMLVFVARYFGLTSLAGPLYKELAQLLDQAFSSGFGRLFS